MFLFKKLLNISTFNSFYIKIPIIDPFSKLKFFFEIIFVVVTFLYLIYIPLEISFSLKISIEFEALFLTINIINILIFINSGFIKEGNTIVNRKEILKRYLKKNFFIDLSIICLIIFKIIYYKAKFKNMDLGNIIKLLFFLKYKQISKILEILFEKQRLNFKYEFSLRLAKLISISLLITHILSCFWHLVAQ